MVVFQLIPLLVVLVLAADRATALEGAFATIQQDKEWTTLTRLVDTVQASSFVDGIEHLTWFAAQNDAWYIIIPTLELEDVIQNMVFDLEEPLSIEKLKMMDGQQITSANNKQWDLQVSGDQVFVTNAGGDIGLTNCTLNLNQTNSLTVSNGIVYKTNCLFLDFNYSRTDVNAPTFAPISRTTAPHHMSVAMPSTYASDELDTTLSDGSQEESGGATVLGIRSFVVGLVVMGALLVRR